MDKESGNVVTPDVVKNNAADALPISGTPEVSSGARPEFSEDTSDISEETDQIRSQIDETRAEMGQTIDAIQERLSYANISEQVSDQVNNAIETAKDSVYEATIGQVVKYMKTAGDEMSKNSMVKTVRENPLPFILIGAGAGLLAYNSYNKKEYGNGGTNRDYSTAGLRSGEYGKSKYDSSEKHADGVESKVAGVASSAYDGIASAATSTVEGARDIAGRAYDKAGELGKATKTKYEHYIEEKPMVIGALALAAGAAVGLSIPITRYEGELMGEARQNLFTKAEETATGFVDKAKEVATEAGRTISEEMNAKTA